ncbi:MAG: after-VIT domain-containing protein [Pseudanabaena sp.]
MRYSPSESNTLSRRYELPTCLLEVWTERSPLSDWQSQIVAQNLQFRLQLAHSKKVIKGNQQQITNLIEIVTAYCDRWLAQDDLATLNHAITVPRLPKLQLSTLQLFDLYESLERCSNEFVILPNLVLEVRRLNPNWLKIVAGAIAIVGVSIGTIRLISPPFGEQPSYQIASTPAASDPEKISTIPPSPPAAISQDQEASRAKVDSAPKSANPINPQPNLSASSPSPSNIDSASPSSSSPNIDRNYNKPDKPEKVAIATESSIDPSSNTRQSAMDRPPVTNAKPVMPATQPRRLERKDNLSAPTTVTGEVASSTAAPPAAPSINLPVPLGNSNVVNGNNSATSSIKVLQIQSELPSDLTASLVRYVQAQQINISTKGTIVFDLEIVNDRVVNIATDHKDSALKEPKAIAEVEKLILEWRSSNPITGKIRMVLQLSP